MEIITVATGEENFQVSSFQIRLFCAFDLNIITNAAEPALNS